MILSWQTWIGVKKILAIVYLEVQYWPSRWLGFLLSSLFVQCGYSFFTTALRESWPDLLPLQCLGSTHIQKPIHAHIQGTHKHCTSQAYTRLFFSGYGEKRVEVKADLHRWREREKSAKSGTAANILVLFFLKRKKVAVKKGFLVWRLKSFVLYVGGFCLVFSRDHLEKVCGWAS